MRRGIALAVFALDGCVWRPSGSSDCTRLHSSAGYAQVDRLATELVRLGNAVHGQWEVCGSNPDAIAAFETDVRRRNLNVEHASAEVGSCVRIPVSLEATGANIRSASDVVCRVAVAHGASYVSWSAKVGDQFVWIAPSGWSVRPFQPPAR